MDYLKNIGFTSEEIENLVENVPTKVLDLLKENYKLVTQNLNFIKDLVDKLEKSIEIFDFL